MKTAPSSVREPPARRPDRWRSHEWIVTLPSLGWLLALFIAPTLIVFSIAFKPADLFGGVGPGWTLDTLRSLGNPNYPAIVWRTLWLSLATTAVCLLVGIPCGYYLARAPIRWRNTLVMLTVVPFWTSFLVRIFAWKHLLHPEGPVRRVLTALGLCDSAATLLYNPGAVLLVMIYTYLPFAILPIYAAAEKFDYQLIEAATDLGATRWRAFRSVFLPGIRVAIFTAVLVVFIPCLGSFVIPDVVGGPSAEMIGNKIAQRAFSDRNLPHAAALSALLTLAVLAPLIVAWGARNRSGRRAVPVQEAS